MEFAFPPHPQNYSPETTSLETDQDLKAHWNCYRRHANLLIIVYESKTEYSAVLNRVGREGHVLKLMANFEGWLGWHVILLEMNTFVYNDVIKLSANWSYFDKKRIFEAKQCFMPWLQIVFDRRLLL